MKLLRLEDLRMARVKLAFNHQGLAAQILPKQQLNGQIRTAVRQCNGNLCRLGNLDLTSLAQKHTAAFIRKDIRMSFNKMFQVVVVVVVVVVFFPQDLPDFVLDPKIGKMVESMEIHHGV